jgi:hypothetical protein
MGRRRLCWFRVAGVWLGGGGWLLCSGRRTRRAERRRAEEGQESKTLGRRLSRRGTPSCSCLAGAVVVIMMRGCGKLESCLISRYVGNVDVSVNASATLALS